MLNHCVWQEIIIKLKKSLFYFPIFLLNIFLKKHHPRLLGTCFKSNKFSAVIRSKSISFSIGSNPLWSKLGGKKRTQNFIKNSHEIVLFSSIVFFFFFSCFIWHARPAQKQIPFVWKQFSALAFSTHHFRWTQKQVPISLIVSFSQQLNSSNWFFFMQYITGCRQFTEQRIYSFIHIYYIYFELVVRSP